MQKKDLFAEKIQVIAESSKIILDVGGGRKFAKGMKQYESLLAKSDYKILDNVAEYQPDILGDITDIPLPDNSVDAIICKAVLEHVSDPFKAVGEMYRILKPGGKCLGYVPFLYAYHAEAGKYGDYWRYTHQGIRHLFKNFSELKVEPVRGLFETIVYLLPTRLLRKGLSPIGRMIDKVFTARNQHSGYFFFAVK